MDPSLIRVGKKDILDGGGVIFDVESPASPVFYHLSMFPLFLLFFIFFFSRYEASDKAAIPFFSN
jgi:hypothetical protein